VDGYLNMREIADLDLEAEFVALSACETGLGRIYRGSGAVSLAQAFMRAGAQSVAVSLWPVYDASTSRFMKAVYRRAWRHGTSWSTAIAETKRAFAAGAHGERLRAPRFWAPFVYYGREAR
jgi:CHAT domain-containing protein